MSITAPDAVSHRTDRRPAAAALREVTVSYGATDALRDCSLEIHHGETVALLGPSGSGKSTALKALAGFEAPSRGAVLLGGRDVTGLSPAQRGIGIVVQSYALFPHMNVRKNVGFGLRARRVPPARTRERVDEALRMVGMFDYADRLPRELSGGQQQRVAIARALAIRPRVLLLDEPLSALDAALRQSMLHELQQLRRRLPDLAMVYVTHDQGEALALADRIALMRDSRLESLGRTEEMFERPSTEFAATFLGGADILPARTLTAAGAGETVRAAYGGHEISVLTREDLPRDHGISLAVRPWSWQLADDAVPAPNPVFAAEVDGVQWKGSSYRVQATAESTGQTLHVEMPARGRAPAVGGTLSVTVAPRDVMVLPAERSDGA
ncbi:ABC transporter ATP-binding protein [Rothia halotolerans]|uniref:ABC transporter ATP-binding protein n=1 Tax=Rothia halotolerans TaxID=405770 RepID=UPI00101B60EC|nr:ABC transporter ATP-binding protein [Rothia halotolerans]